MTQTIEKLRKVRDHDRQIRRKYELQPRPKLLPFRAWLRKKSTLGETVMGNPIQDSLLGFIPGNATANERQETIDSLAAAILGMTGDTTITVVSVGPEIN
jgi:hypothetical protein